MSPSASLAALTPSGQAIVDETGTGPKNLGHVAVEAVTADVSIQSTCVGTGQVAVAVKTDDGEQLTGGGSMCLSRPSQGSRSAGNTIRKVDAGGGINVRVIAPAGATWHVTVSVLSS